MYILIITSIRYSYSDWRPPCISALCASSFLPTIHFMDMVNRLSIMLSGPMYGARKAGPNWSLSSV